MKTKEISFDVIQKIKANNKLAEFLQTIEKIMDDLYFNHSGLDTDFFNDKEDDSYNYWHSFAHCLELYQRELVKQSKELMK